jgi:hypothetical protein
VDTQHLPNLTDDSVAWGGLHLGRLSRQLDHNGPWPGTAHFNGMLETFNGLRRMSRRHGLAKLGAVSRVVEGTLHDLGKGLRPPTPELLALLRESVAVSEAILANVEVFGQEGAVACRHLVKRLARPSQPAFPPPLAG